MTLHFPASCLGYTCRCCVCDHLTDNFPITGPCSPPGNHLGYVHVFESELMVTKGSLRAARGSAKAYSFLWGGGDCIQASAR